MEFGPEWVENSLVPFQKLPDVRSIDLKESQFLDDDEISFLFTDQTYSLYSPFHKSLTNAMGILGWTLKTVNFDKNPVSIKEIYSSENSGAALVRWGRIRMRVCIGNPDGSYQTSYYPVFMVLSPFVEQIWHNGESSIFDLTTLLKSYPKNKIIDKFRIIYEMGKSSQTKSSYNI